MSNATELGLGSEIFGQIAYHFNLIQPYLKTEVYTVAAALFPIIIGAHASLTRPPSAAKPAKRRKAKHDGGDSEEDEDEEDNFQRMEGFSRSDALFLPLYAGATLTGLYFLIKYLKDLDVLNMVLNYYFSSVGVFSVCKLLADALQLMARFVFPRYYRSLSDGKIWKVEGRRRQAVHLVGGANKGNCYIDVLDKVSHEKDVTKADAGAPRTSPLPGFLAHLPVPASINGLLWSIRQIVDTKLTFKFYLHRVVAARVHMAPLSILGTVLGLAATLYYNFVEKTWWLTNLMGFAFSYTALQLITPTTFDTGSLILAALFVYDVVMVFYTPMMVTVAKNLDVPIKLLIPRESDTEGVAQFSMLGLGDVVLPGMMIALALRFDLYLHYLKIAQKSKVPDPKTKEMVTMTVRQQYTSPNKHWADQFWTSTWFGGPSVPREELDLGTFSKPYFWASFVGYVIGMLVTLCVMITFQHAQPALLYLVPAVLISLWGTAFLRGEITLMYEYTEAEEESVGETSKPLEDNKTVAEVDGLEDVKDDNTKPEVKGGGSKPKSNGSFFSSAKLDRNSQKLDKAISKLIEHDHTTDDEDTREKSKEKVEAVEKKLRKDPSNDLIYFGVSWYQPKKRRPKVENAKTTKIEKQFRQILEPQLQEDHANKRRRVA